MRHTIIATKDLRAQFGASRDQGPRPTCLAFAASDLHAGIRPGWAPLSCEAAFFHAQRRGGRPPTTGAALLHMLEALAEDGQPIESAWPYLRQGPTSHDSWSPPPFTGQTFKRDGLSLAADWSSLTDLLDLGRPVLLLLTLSRSFFVPVEGVVEAANDERPEPALRHAVLAVGYGSVDGTPAVLVRNSWGEAWGQGGHAWLRNDFTTARLFGIALLEEDEDVSRRSAAA